MKLSPITFTVTRTDEGAHIHMTQETAHVLEGFGCWCAPNLFALCDDCDKGCWKCEGGKFPITLAEAEALNAEDEPVMVVHR